MKLLVMSDIHLESSALELRPTDCDLVILAGDIGIGTRGVEWAIAQFQDKPVLYIPGNHEYYYGEVNTTLAAMRAAGAGANVYVLDRECLTFGEIRFLGATLWSDFRLFSGADETETMWSKVDARRWIPDFDGRIRLKGLEGEIEVSPDVSQRWHQQTVEWLHVELAKPFEGKTVIISHHAPCVQSIPYEYAEIKSTPAYASHLDELVSLSDLWIHGHVHSSADYSIASCRVLCNPRGYERENLKFDPELVIEL